jgi:type II pantothenate kinase
MIIGIDIGSTTTKAVSIEAGGVVGKIKTKALDAVTSATGAFGKLLVERGIKISQVSRIMMTGAGATKILRGGGAAGAGELFGIPTYKTGEIEAIGIGGMFQARRENIIIANIGTGTAIIEARRGRIAHICGSGVGGGTILGLAKKMLGTTNFNGIMDLAGGGNLRQVDLLLEDIMDNDLSFLNKEATASNFGKLRDTAQREDLALGILNMVYQVIGMLSVFAARSKNLNSVLVTGNGSGNVIGRRVLDAITGIYGTVFEYPEDAEYTTAIGAGLSSLE